MDKKTGIIAFGLLALLTLAMAIATLVEHQHGRVYVGIFVYNNLWFTLLWIFMGTMGCYYIAVTSLHKRLLVFTLHISFLLILFGALATRLTSITGHIHLREDQPAFFFIDDWTQKKVIFPFSISLQSFEIEYYPGTVFPANYISKVDITDSKTGNIFEHTISMNNILRHKGFRFYQSSFDEDLKGSILSVNRDIWGIPLTYAGYYLMFLSMLLILFDRRERFRFLLRKLAVKPKNLGDVVSFHLEN